MRIFLIYVSLIFLIFINLNYSHASQRVYNYNVPDELSLVLSTKSFAKYLISLKNAYSDGVNIKDKYKRKFPAKVQFNNKIIRATARITGDWKDHISEDQSYSSLSINLKEGNIGGIVKFRLLRPNTRRESNEVLWSILMEQIGYPVPYRKFIKVKFLGKKFDFIFEERPQKEFLEAFGFRETAIIEFDERQIWSNRQHRETKKQLVNESFFGNQWILDNRNFLKTKTALKIYMRSQNFKNKSVQNFNEVNNIHARHGLIAHNRKFIYDPIYNYMIPIYFDGNVYANDCDLSQKFNLTPQNVIDYNIIIAEFFDRTKSVIDNTKYPDRYQKCMVKQILSMQKKNVNFGPFLVKPIKKIIKDQDLVLFKSDKLEYKAPYANLNSNNIKNSTYCVTDKLNTNCKKISFKEIKNIVIGKNPPLTHLGYEYFDGINISFAPEREYKYLNLNSYKKNNNLEVPRNTSLIVKGNFKNSKLNILLNGSNSKVVFVKSSFLDSKISVKSIIDPHNILDNKNDSRYDTSLNTGCMSMWDSKIDNTSIYSINCVLEDAINLVRTNGSDVSVNVNNASYDAFDADFSKIDFNQVNIFDAGNDCFDVSSGIYKISNAYFKNCGDKGFSIGERSFATITNATIDNAEDAVVSKDLSYVYVSNINVKNVNNCLSAYAKKQEHGGANIIYENLSSDCSKFKVDTFSNIREGDICIQMGRTNWFSYCFTKTNLKLKITKKLPSDSHFFFNGYQKLKSKMELFNKRYNNECKDFPCYLTLETEILTKKENHKFGLLSLTSKTNEKYFEVSLR